MAHKTIAKPTKAAVEIMGENHFKDHVSGHVAISEADEAQRQLDALDVAEKRAAKEKDLAENGYKYRRAEKFKAISIGDQLDAIWKALDQSGMALPVEAKNIITAIKAIKDSEPKPGGL